FAGPPVAAGRPADVPAAQGVQPAAELPLAAVRVPRQAVLHEVPVDADQGRLPDLVAAVAGAGDGRGEGPAELLPEQAVAKDEVADGPAVHSPAPSQVADQLIQPRRPPVGRR